MFASVYYRCIQGMAEAQQLRIVPAERNYLYALRLAEQHVGSNSVAAALPASLIARVRYEQGRLDEAESLLIDRMPLINAGTMLDCVLSAYFVMAKIAVHRMNFELAHTLFERAENLDNSRGWGRLTAVQCWSGRVYASGRVESTKVSNTLIVSNSLRRNTRPQRLAPGRTSIDTRRWRALVLRRRSDALTTLCSSATWRMSTIATSRFGWRCVPRS